jgi:hypothetical protein
LLEWVTPGTGDWEYGSGGRVRLTAEGRTQAEVAAQELQSAEGMTAAALMEWYRTPPLS